MKTMAIRQEEDQHAQLCMIAQLEELTVADAIRQAIDQWVEARRNNPQLQQRAEAVLAEIERDATTVEEPSPPCWAKRLPRHHGRRAPGVEPLGARPKRRVVGQLVASATASKQTPAGAPSSSSAITHSLTELLPHTK